MRARFVIGVGMTLLMLGTGNRAWAQAGNYIAGFDIRWLKDYEPAKEALKNYKKSLFGVWRRR